VKKKNNISGKGRGGEGGHIWSSGARRYVERFGRYGALKKKKTEKIRQSRNSPEFGTRWCAYKPLSRAKVVPDEYGKNVPSPEVVTHGGANRVSLERTESRSRDTMSRLRNTTKKTQVRTVPGVGLGEYRVRDCGLNTVSRCKSTREKTLGLVVPKPGLARSRSKLEGLSKNLIKPLFAKFLSLTVSLEKKRRSVRSRNRDSTRPTYGIIKIEVKSVNFGHHAKKV
jgi:hypothetical protein